MEGNRLRKVLTKISDLSLVLPYYAELHQCHNLMTHLDSKAHTVWKDNMKSWGKLMNKGKRKIRISPKEFKSLESDSIKSLFKFEFQLSFNDILNGGVNLINQFKLLDDAVKSNIEKFIIKSCYIQGSQSDSCVKSKICKFIKELSVVLNLPFKESNVLDSKGQIISIYHINSIFEISGNNKFDDPSVDNCIITNGSSDLTTIRELSSEAPKAINELSMDKLRITEELLNRFLKSKKSIDEINYLNKVCELELNLQSFSFDENKIELFSKILNDYMSNINKITITSCEPLKPLKCAPTLCCFSNRPSVPIIFNCRESNTERLGIFYLDNCYIYFKDSVIELGSTIFVAKQRKIYKYGSDFVKFTDFQLKETRMLNQEFNLIKESKIIDLVESICNDQADDCVLFTLSKWIRKIDLSIESLLEEKYREEDINDIIDPESLEISCLEKMLKADCILNLQSLIQNSKSRIKDLEVEDYSYIFNIFKNRCSFLNLSLKLSKSLCNFDLACAKSLTLILDMCGNSEYSNEMLYDINKFLSDHRNVNQIVFVYTKLNSEITSIVKKMKLSCDTKISYIKRNFLNSF